MTENSRITLLSLLLTCQYAIPWLQTLKEQVFHKARLRANMNVSLAGKLCWYLKD